MATAPPTIRTIRNSVCPHDCPSTCALEVEGLDGARIGRVHGAKANSYTSGVICAKVGRYAERIHHPDRLTRPLLRVGPKGSGEFREIGWDEALDRIAERFLDAAGRFGSEAVWPYYYAGTMGLVMRDGINRLRHVMRYSRQKKMIRRLAREPHRLPLHDYPHFASTIRQTTGRRPLCSGVMTGGSLLLRPAGGKR